MHHPDCDVNDPNIEGIQKPCNCPHGWSGGPTTGTAGPVGSLGRATGSNPVSESEILRVASALEDNARTRELVVGSRHPIDAFEKRALQESRALYAAAGILRRHAASATERQPESNVAGLPRAGNAATPTPSTQSNS